MELRVVGKGVGGDGWGRKNKSMQPLRQTKHSLSLYLFKLGELNQSLKGKTRQGMAAESSASTLRVTVVQASSVFHDTPATMNKAKKLVEEAAGQGSKLILFPEAFIGGYPRGSNYTDRTPEGQQKFLNYHASAINVPGPEVEILAAMAERYKVYLVMGVIEKEGYTLYCTVLFFNPNGEYMGKHRKLMPTALERLVWGFGDGSTLPVYDTPIGKIGSVICWENMMPLLRTAMYAKGIQIYCAPTADGRETWPATMTHVAHEGGCFVLSANQFCRRKDYPPAPEYRIGRTDEEEEELGPETVVCKGGSMIVSPFGKILAGPNWEGEDFITADIDLGEITKAKMMFDVVGHYSRPDVLTLAVNETQTSPVTFGKK